MTNLNEINKKDSAYSKDSMKVFLSRYDEERLKREQAELKAAIKASTTPFDELPYDQQTFLEQRRVTNNLKHERMTQGFKQKFPIEALGRVFQPFKEDGLRTETMHSQTLKLFVSYTPKKI